MYLRNSSINKINKKTNQQLCRLHFLVFKELVYRKRVRLGFQVTRFLFSKVTLFDPVYLLSGQNSTLKCRSGEPPVWPPRKLIA